MYSKYALLKYKNRFVFAFTLFYRVILATSVNDLGFFSSSHLVIQLPFISCASLCFIVDLTLNTPP